VVVLKLTKEQEAAAAAPAAASAAAAPAKKKTRLPSALDAMSSATPTFLAKVFVFVY